MHRIGMILALAAVSCGRSNTIPDAPTCRECAIEIQRTVRLGTAEGPEAFPGDPMWALEDGRGRFWVAVNGHAVPMIFDSSGRFIQYFGREGDGPGEFRFLQPVQALPGDSVLVWEPMQFLVVGPDLTVARMINTPEQIGRPAPLEWPTRVYGTARGPMSRTSTTYRHALYDMSGDTARETVELMRLTDDSPLETPASHWRVPGEVDGEAIWLAHLGRYAIDRLAVAGPKIDMQLERQPDWFPGEMKTGWGTPDVPPWPQMVGVKPDSEGRLWVYSRKPRDNWQLAWRGRTAAAGNEVRVSDLPPTELLWTTVLEVIDPERRRVVVRKELSDAIVAIWEHNRILSKHEDAAGIPYLEVLQLSLREQR